MIAVKNDSMAKEEDFIDMVKKSVNDQIADLKKELSGELSERFEKLQNSDTLTPCDEKKFSDVFARLQKFFNKKAVAK